MNNTATYTLEGKILASRPYTTYDGKPRPELTTVTLDCGTSINDRAIPTHLAQLTRTGDIIRLTGTISTITSKTTGKKFDRIDHPTLVEIIEHAKNAA